MMFDKKNLANVVTAVFLFTALMVTGLAVKRTLDMRNRAATTGTKFYIDPASVELKVGETKEFAVYVDTSDTGEKVAFVEGQLCYGPKIKIASQSADVYKPQEEYFNDVDLIKGKRAEDIVDGTTAGVKCLNFALSSASVTSDNLKSGVVKTLIVRFTGVETGSEKVSFTQDPLKTYYNNNLSDEPGIIAAYTDSEITVVTPSEGSESLITLDGSKLATKVGETGEVIVKLDTSSSSREVDGFQATVCYGKEYKIGNTLADVTVANSTSKGLSSIFRPITVIPKTDGSGTCATIAMRASAEDGVELPSGSFDVLRIKLEAVIAGKGTVYLDKEQCEVSGPSVPGKGNAITHDIGSAVAYEVLSDGGKFWQCNETTKICGEISETTCNLIDNCIRSGDCPVGYTCPSTTDTPKPTPTDTPEETGLIFNFKMTFQGLMSNASECGEKWNNLKIKLVDSKGKESPLMDVAISPEDALSMAVEPMVFKGKVYLGEYVPEGDVFALMRGPIHITDKYGMDAQNGEYNIYLGKLNGMTENLETTKLFDFTKYALRGGDVDANDMLNGADYTKIKDSLSCTESTCLNSDINGDCVVNAADTTFFIDNIKIRNGKLY